MLLLNIIRLYVYFVHFESFRSFVRLLDEPTCGGGSEDAHIASCFIREHTQFLRLYTIYCQSYKK